uniref:LPXTG cell wall anchor domain-containing protein n=1 Tax=uncultured Streptococcus sp. TaxID=83427 RepID=UPI003211BA5F
AKNPGKEVTVGDDGTATVTDPTTGISHTIPGTELVNQDFEPVKPTGDGQQRPATPSADTNRRPDTATPAEVPATQQAEQPSQTVEVPAQLPNKVSETDPSVSQPQAVLPNTGTQEDRANGALGLLSLLGAFGLLFAKKKKDDEEEA